MSTLVTTPHSQTEFWNRLRDLTNKSVVYLHNLPTGADKEYHRLFAYDGLIEHDVQGEFKKLEIPKQQYQQFYNHVSKEGFSYAIKYGVLAEGAAGAAEQPESQPQTTPVAQAFTWYTPETIIEVVPPRIVVKSKQYVFYFNPAASHLLKLSDNGVMFTKDSSGRWFIALSKLGFIVNSEGAERYRHYRFEKKKLVEKLMAALATTEDIIFEVDTTPITIEGLTAYGLKIVKDEK